MKFADLFSFLKDSLISEGTLFFFKDYDFFSSIFSINSDFSVNKYSNEFFYLINFYYPSWSLYYEDFVNHCNYIINNQAQIQNEIVIINEDVLMFMTTFSRGAVHGFSGFYYTLIEYLNNREKYKKLKLLINADSQAGILNIINYLCDTNVIDRKKLIYVEKKKYYRFLSITYIPNKYHVFTGELIPNADNFIKKYFIKTDLPNSINSNSNIVSVLKCGITTNVSNDGIIPENVIVEFCNKYNINRINPHNEVDTINSIYSCEILVISYGSAFFKNFMYISNNCKKVIVVVNGEIYKNDYAHLSSILPSEYQGIIFKKYKNADFIYTIINDDLNFNPYELE